MTNLEIIENNKLIAEFMGAIHCNDAPEDYPNGYYLTTTEEESDLPLLPEEWEFHSSWDWLMPVVEKIESLGFYTNIKKASDGTHLMTIKQFEADLYGMQQPPIWRESKLEATCEAVIEFINWYNQQNPKP